MAWQETWHTVIVPHLPLKGLVALEKALETNDPRLIQRSATKPGILTDRATGAEPLEGGCGVTYCGWFGLGLITVAEGLDFFDTIGQKINEDWKSGPAPGIDFVRWFDRMPRDQMIRDLLPEVRQAIANKRNACMNQCSEISLGDPQPVMPWVQVDLMNQIRVKQGLQPFTTEERTKILKELENVSNQAGRDQSVSPVPSVPETRDLSALNVRRDVC